MSQDFAAPLVALQMVPQSAPQLVPLVAPQAASSPSLEAAAHGLYDPAMEHDACGVGFVANIKGKPSHALVTQGLKILENLSHRGADRKSVV